MRTMQDAFRMLFVGIHGWRTVDWRDAHVGIVHSYVKSGGTRRRSSHNVPLATESWITGWCSSPGTKPTDCDNK
jgi:hypothetical protein